MGKIYTINKMTEDGFLQGNVWEKVEKANIDSYPWNQNSYMPKADTRVVYTDAGFHVLMTAYENKILGRYLDLNDPVYRDSCMEFFLMPEPENDSRYLNFELNPLGTLNLGIGKNRFEHTKITDVEPGLFHIAHSVTKESIKSFSGPFWSLQYFIPFGFIKGYFGNLKFNTGKKMAGNFYKCAEDTDLPHFGSWNTIINKIPDFHRPECFGSLILG